MYCSECRGMYPTCPMCGDEGEPCDRCNGSGRYWTDEDGNEFPAPFDGLEEAICEECNGTGVVILEAPEY